MSVRLLAIMGSGETAPTMIKPHRQLFDQLGDAPGPAILLDTPYGFQANADDISERAVAYFDASVGRSVEPVDLRRVTDADPVRVESALARLAAARWVFAGPGSPTYALQQWAGTDVPKLLADKLANGGCVVFASAAALTLGRFTVPVYEIYKVGADPVWAEGLDLLAPWWRNLAVIPHYDNAEGGTHDTRFCYLGESRLARLEEQLPDDGWVLGVDEHTGCVLDLAGENATVVGNGGITVRRHGVSHVIPSGETLSMAALLDLASGKGTAGAPEPAPRTEATPGPARPATALHGEIQRIEADFDDALAAGDVERAVRAVLQLDDTLVEWAGDTTQSDAGDRGRAALRRMIVRLGELAVTGTQNPVDLVGGYVDALLQERAAARDGQRFDDADRVRDALIGLGIEVRDGPDGTNWSFR